MAQLGHGLVHGLRGRPARMVQPIEESGRLRRCARPHDRPGETRREREAAYVPWAHEAAESARVAGGDVDARALSVLERVVEAERRLEIRRLVVVRGPGSGFEGLVTFETEQEMEAVRDANLFVLGCSWVDASDNAAEGTWLWRIDASTTTQFWSGGPSGEVTLPFNFAFWEASQSDSTPTTKDGGCVDMQDFLMRAVKHSDARRASIVCETAAARSPRSMCIDEWPAATMHTRRADLVVCLCVRVLSRLQAPRSPAAWATSTSRSAPSSSRSPRWSSNIRS